MTKLAIALSALVLCSAPGSAAADDTFDALARSSRRVDEVGLAALFWSQLEACDKIGNDFSRRQCHGLREARQAQVAKKTYVIAGGRGALHGGTFDAKGKKLPIAFEACVVCDDGVKIDGKKKLVTGKGKRQVAGGALRAAGLGQAALAVADQAEADALKKDGLARVRSEFVVRLSAKLDSWTAGGLGGYGVEVVGFRVWDACDGRILAARPKAARAEPDRSTCPAEKAPPPEKPVAAKPAEPAQPERASSNEINQALAPIRTAAQACFETYGVAGKANLKVEFDKAGQITSLVLEGDFAETPTGSCIEKAARQVVFPASKKKSTKVSFPLVLE